MCLKLTCVPPRRRWLAVGAQRLAGISYLPFVKRDVLRLAPWMAEGFLDVIDTFVILRYITICAIGGACLPQKRLRREEGGGWDLRVRVSRLCCRCVGERANAGARGEPAVRASAA